MPKHSKLEEKDFYELGSRISHVVNNKYTYYRIRILIILIRMCILPYDYGLLFHLLGIWNTCRFSESGPEISLTVLTWQIEFKVKRLDSFKIRRPSRDSASAWDISHCWHFAFRAGRKKLQPTEVSGKFHCFGNFKGYKCLTRGSIADCYHLVQKGPWR